MKQGFARQHSRHRDQTPSVIYLPPPKPPVTAKRETVDTAGAAASAVPVQNSPQSRQARRKAMRDEAKALRRTGHSPAARAHQARPSPKLAADAMAEAQALEAAPAPVMAPASATTPAPATAPEPSAPVATGVLPRERALVAAKPGGFALIVQRVRRFFIVPRKRALPADRAAIAGQLRGLQAELAALQQSIDRMIDGVTA